MSPIGPALALLGASLVHAADPCDAPEAGRVLTLAADVAEAGSDTNRPGRSAVAAGNGGWMAVTCTPAGLSALVVSRAGEVDATATLAQGSCASGYRTGIAFGSSDFLVVLEQGGAIRGIRVSPAGSVIDAGGGIAIAAGPSDYGPAVAAGSGAYLAVWQRYQTATLQDIYGAVVTADGRASAPFPIFVGDGEQSFPAVACGDTSCLVVWRDTPSGSGPSPDSDVRGARVALDGTVLDPAGFPLATSAGVDGDPAVAFDGTGYLVAWTHLDGDFYADGSRIGATRVEGSAAGALIDVATGATPKTSPRVAFDGERFWVTWWVDGYRGRAPVGVAAARVLTDGTLLDAPATGDGLRLAQPRCDTCRLVHPDLAFDGDTGLLAWTNNEETIGTAKDVEGRLIRARAAADPCFSLAGTAILRASASANGVTCSLACRQPYSEALIFEPDRRYRIPASVDGLVCPLGGTVDIPDEVGRVRGRRRLALKPENLRELKRALASCFGRRARIGRYRTTVQGDVDGPELRGRVAASAIYRAQVPVQTTISTRFTGVRRGSGLPLVPPALPPRQARLPLCSADLTPRCTR